MLQNLLIICFVSLMKLSSSLNDDDDICSCGDELYCSITPPKNTIYPCYLGTIESTTNCFLNDPLINKNAIWQCGNCSDFGFDTYIKNDPIYNDMELWTLGSKKINEIEDNSFKLSALNKDFKLTDIIANDGIILKSIVFDPVPIESNKKNPAIIFISSWGMNKWEYVIPANEYAKRGYTVISYTARGFWGSGGEINMAGELDQADISAVIDWMLKNTNADVNRIGMSGISYGGGLSLLGSAMEPRVKSIAAMSCWVDLANSFLSNGETIRKEAARFLEVLAEITGKPSDDLETLFEDYFGNKNLDFLYEYTYNSSAINYIENINKNKPAIFIANALGDSLFTPNQFVSFFNDLTVTKHLEFAPGDHAGPELPGLFHIPDQVWNRSFDFMDFYLLNNHATSEIDPAMPTIIFNTMNGNEIESFNNWNEVTTSNLVFQFDTKENLVELKSKSLSFSSDILQSITTGKGAGINGGIAYISSTVRAYVDVQRRFEMALIDRLRGAVFISNRLKSDYQFRGIPNLKLNIQPSSTNGTLVVYLLAVDDLNFGHLFTFSPWTFKNVDINQMLTVDIDLTMTAYDFPAGHRLGVVISSHDTLYLDQNPCDIKIEFLGGSILSMPIHS